MCIPGTILTVQLLPSNRQSLPACLELSVPVLTSGNFDFLIPVSPGLKGLSPYTNLN